MLSTPTYRPFTW